MAEKYSADIEGSRKTVPPPQPSAGDGPACDDSNFWTPADKADESTIDAIEKGFGLK